MRIGHFTDSYFPIVNGVSNSIHLYNRALATLGHEHFVFTFGYTKRVDTEPNIFRSWGIPLGRTGYHVGPRYSRHAWSVAKTMDVLHAHHPFVCGVLAARLSRQHNKPLIFTNHTRYDLYASHYLRLLPKRAVQALLGAWMRRFTRRCDLVIAVSAAAQDMLRSFDVDAPIEIISNGIELERFSSATPAARSTLDLPTDAFVLAYVGRLGPEKNLSSLLDAFAHARSTAPHIVLMLIGDGALAKSLRQRAHELGLGDSVRFLGLRPYEEIPTLLGAADAFVTASITEGRPLTILEAMAAGRPVLGFDTPGIHETIIDGEGGLLAPLDPVALGEQMARIATDGELHRRLSAGALRISQQYSIETTARRTLEHYERLIRARQEKASVHE